MIDSLIDGLSVFLGPPFHTTSSSSEDWFPLIDGDSDPLALPTIRSLAFLKNVSTAHRQSTICHPNLIILLV